MRIFTPTSNSAPENETATLPCNTLPVSQNHEFYGRQNLLHQLETHLSPADAKSSDDLSSRSIALYGLSGVGKTQTALAYAYRKLYNEHVDAVFWIAAEDVLSIRKSFTHVAVDALKLPGAHPQAEEENMVLVLNWLRRTSAKWLLIFDNVDSHDILDDCWPIVSKHGAVLVTTRDIRVAASLPIDIGLEINEFSIDEGAEFVLQMANNRQRIDGEVHAARKVAHEVGGLPLALNQICALINKRSCSIKDFRAMYTTHEERPPHYQKKSSGWKSLGYKYSLDTIFEMSFAALGTDAQICLGVLSFYSADSVPADVFIPTNTDHLPHLLLFIKDKFRLTIALDELRHHALVRKNINQRTFRIHRLVQSEYLARMENAQEQFEAATELLLPKFPAESSNKYDDEEWLITKRYIPQVLALTRNYNDSQNNDNPLKPNMNFVRLLTVAANAIHDNDTADVVGGLLETAETAYKQSPNESRDDLLWAFVQSLSGMHHFCTSEFARSEKEVKTGLSIRGAKLKPDDLLLCLSYSWLGMAVGAQGRYEEGLQWLLKAGVVLEGPAGNIPTRRMVWSFNTSRNYYCMGRYEEAEDLLSRALEDAEAFQNWYFQLYAHLTFSSLRTRMEQLDAAKLHVEKAKQILQVYGAVARFSWLSSYCAYRAGDISMKQGLVKEAIEETEKAVTIGKLVRVPRGILCRCIHAYGKALAMDTSRREESERQRLEARRLRSELPSGGGDLDDESDEAFESLVKMDHR